MTDDDLQEGTTDDTTAAGEGATQTSTTTTDKGAETVKGGEAGGDKSQAGDKSGERVAADKSAKTLATGADSEEADKAAEKVVDKGKPPPAWELTDDMRKAIAEHVSAGDKKLYDKELKRLERVRDMRTLWGSYRELDNRLNEGGLIKVPGKDAKPEEIAAYHKAIGVPEKAEEYFKDLKLENGAVIGDADKPFINDFAGAMHKAGATPTQMTAALNWYYKDQEARVAAQDDADEEYRREAERAVKDEWGASFKRRANAIGTIFASAPGGADAKNEKSLFARLMGGRTADGRVIGNDPDVLRWLDSLRNEVNPAATLVEDGNQSGVSLNDEIAKIEKVMRENRREYNEKYAGRYAELLAARDKIQARQRA